MNSYVSLLRGINVSGKNKIKMADLRTQLSDIGLSDVATYIQSGNILFKSKEQDADLLANQIKELLLSEYSYDVPVLVRSADYWNRIAANHPFLTTGEEPLNQLYVVFLKELPSAEHLDSIKGFTHKDDVFMVKDDAIYLYCPGGYGVTKLTNNFFERKLKVQATTRNWKTVSKLKELLEG